jgi:hypothetical protein
MLLAVLLLYIPSMLNAILVLVSNCKQTCSVSDGSGCTHERCSQSYTVLHHSAHILTCVGMLTKLLLLLCCDPGYSLLLSSHYRRVHASCVLSDTRLAAWYEPFSDTVHR